MCDKLIMFTRFIIKNMPITSFVEVEKDNKNKNKNEEENFVKQNALRGGGYY